MNTSFEINSDTIPLQVAITSENFTDGIIPKMITVTHTTGGKTGWMRQYIFTHVDNNGNYIYRLLAGGMAQKKNKKNTSSECIICIIGEGLGGTPTVPCSVTEQELKRAFDDTPYTNTLSSTGGTAPYVYTIIAGSLPTGFVLAPNGIISGTHTGQATSSFTIQSTDAKGCVGTQKFTVTVQL